MNSKLAKLAVVAVIALVLAIWAGTSRTPDTAALSQAQPTTPGLKQSINDVTRVRLVGAESKPIVTLEKSGTTWVVVEKDRYPADIAKVREYLLRLADSTLIEPKTAVEASYGKLGVEDIAKPEADGALVEIEGMKEPVKLIVGHFSGRAGEGTFVRRAGDKQSWLAKGNLAIDKTPANWLRRDLADLSTTRIDSVELTGKDGKIVRAFKADAEQPNYSIANVPKGRELASEYVANSLASVPSGLRFDDVRSAKAIEAPTGATAAKYTTFDGLVLDATTFELDGQPYTTFKASIDEAKASAYIAAEQAKLKAQYEAQKAELAAKKPATTPTAEATASAGEATAKDAGDADKNAPAAPEEIAPETPPAVADPAKDAETRMKALRDEVAALNARFDGWAYRLPDYKIENMRKSMADLLKPLEAKK